MILSHAILANNMQNHYQITRKTLLHRLIFSGKLLRRIAYCLPTAISEYLYQHSVLDQVYFKNQSYEKFTKREDMWQYCLNQYGNNKAITYVEFGVWQGYGIGWYAQNHTHEDSRFIGLDSFEGLPDDWARLDKGAFSTDGKTPDIDDRRVEFMVGWFQNTIDDLLLKLHDDNNVLIIHYDADLYESTLFALTRLDILKRPMIAIFDEFYGGEARALHDYACSYLAETKMLGIVPCGKKKIAQAAFMITPLS